MDRPWFEHYEADVPREIEIPDVPITANLRRAAERSPERTAVIFGGLAQGDAGPLIDAKLSYRRLLGTTLRLAAALQALGVQKGDRVALHLPNCPQFVSAYYATLMIGGVVVPCNPQYVARELAHQLADAGATAIVTLERTLPLVRAVREQTALRHVVVTPLAEYWPQELRDTAERAAIEPLAEGEHRLAELVADAAPAPQPTEVNMADTAALLYTGGTTGISKGAQLTHRNLQANAVQIQSWLQFMAYGRETILTALPLFHSYGMSMCMNLGVLTAATLLLIPNARVLPHILEAINTHRPSLYPGVPAMYVAINNYPNVEAYDISSIEACISGAAPLPGEVQQRFQALTGGRLVEGYGLSEASPVTHINPVYGENRTGTIGLPIPGTDARVVDLETGQRTLAPGEPGELAVRGPQVMAGYWNNPEETAQALRDGWLHTGDIACMDEDGYFRIVDRKKDMILGAGGFNVYPREVEEVLYLHPDVQECAVAGVRAGEKGERVKAFVVLKPGASSTAEDIIAFCRQHLAPYKVPKFVEFRDQLPKSAVGKVLRRLLVGETDQA
jgi:long-chain acyl-CoA synthetase